MTRPRPVRACLITNPRSGRGGIDLSEALVVLQANGWDVTVRQKRRGGEATTLARAAADAGADVVVGCGGDGTLSEIVDGLAGSAVAVGVIPGGTVNLWAHELGVSARPRVAALQLLTAERRRADLGQVTINGRHARHFLQMAGLGLDGAVMARVSKPLKRRLGPLAIGLAALRTLPGTRPAPVQITIDGVCWQGSVFQIVAGNTQRYGGFARLTPAARIDDAQLDLCLITAAGPRAALQQAATVLLRGRPDPDSAETYRAAEITVRAPMVIPLQLDGGRVAQKHVVPAADGVAYAFSARPGAVTVLVPRTYGGALFQQQAPGDGYRGSARREDGHTGKHGGEHRCRLQVTSVGVETITGIRVADGGPLTVQLTADTTARDADGSRQPLADFLASLTEGDVLRVKGDLKSDDGVVMARRLKRRGRHGERGHATPEA